MAALSTYGNLSFLSTIVHLVEPFRRVVAELVAARPAARRHWWSEPDTRLSSERRTVVEKSARRIHTTLVPASSRSPSLWIGNPEARTALAFRPTFTIFHHGNC